MAAFCCLGPTEGPPPGGAATGLYDCGWWDGTTILS